MLNAAGRAQNNTFVFWIVTNSMTEFIGKSAMTAQKYPNPKQ